MEQVDKTTTIKHQKRRIRWMLVLYDLIIWGFICFLILWIYPGSENLSVRGILEQMAVGTACIFVCRFLFNIYRQIWRYGGIQSYILLLIADGVAFLAYYLIARALPIEQIMFVRTLSLVCMNLLAALAFRMVYRYMYKCSNSGGPIERTMFKLLVFLGVAGKNQEVTDVQRIKVAIVGAGRVGATLAEELLTNTASPYVPRCFFDTDSQKAGGELHGLPVYMESEGAADLLRSHEIQEVILALPQLNSEQKKKLYERYKSYGCKVKVYDYPNMQSAGRRSIREIDIEELLFRRPIEIDSEKTKAFYRDKTILITGGGGSIGSEMCRQLAKMEPKKLVILDIAENGAYDVQQELRVLYGNSVDVKIEIASICDRKALNRVFEEHQPQIVIMAAAHKHVPLMEKNCIEAVKNNVFGTLNTVEASEQYGAERVIMVSTDKAVNPTNIMGATKRMCELIVQAHSKLNTNTTFSMTRFGNVLGSAGSVIPLFKRQIAHGGPITITDKRIIRYFMTIPEASQLVLESGAMAKNGELFVLDMGQPVKIMDLAENMISLSGAQGIDIVETGLRPGEKLYEELLVQSENLDKTENKLIFIERDTPLSQEEIEEKLSLLQKAIDTDQDKAVKEAMKIAVPTYKAQ